MKRNYMIIILGLAFLCFNLGVSYGQDPGARYKGAYTKSSPIKYVGKKDFVIDGLEISSSGNEISIALYDCENVIIKNCKFGPSPLARAIHLEKCKNVTIIDCTFENVQTGLRASLSQGIKFEHNDVTNLVGPLKGANELGIMAQFVEVSGAGNSISYNACENFLGDSSTEDIINLWMSNGTQQSPIVVRGNWLRGGGDSDSGGGILIGDGGGSYQIAEDNILVDPGQYGIGIAGGHNMTLRNNKVFAKKQYFTNVGMSICNWYEKETGQSHTITVENNILNYTNKGGFVHNWWYHSSMPTVKGKDTNKHDPNMTASILPGQIIGKARSGAVPSDPVTETPGGGSIPLPGDGGQPGNGDTEPEPVEQPDNGGNKPEEGDKDPEIPGVQLPDVDNHPSITIYLDRYNRVCVNIRGRLDSANVIAANGKGEIIYNAPLNRFHTVLPDRPSPDNYIVYIRNGNREHLKTLYIP